MPYTAALRSISRHIYWTFSGLVGGKGAVIHFLHDAADADWFDLDIQFMFGNDLFKTQGSQISVCATDR